MEAHPLFFELPKSQPMLVLVFFSQEFPQKNGLALICSTGWVPFRRSDQPRLDAAEINFRKGKGAKDFVQVEGGRWKVNLRDRTLHDACLRFGCGDFSPQMRDLGMEQDL